MTDEPRKTVIAHNASQGHGVLLLLWEFIKPFLLAGWKVAITVKPVTRSLEQNAKFHAICGDIAKSGLHWAGKQRDAKAWKVLLVSGHSVATGEGHDIVPGLEGEFINLRESTAAMSVKRGASLIEYALAFCAQNSIQLIDDQRGDSGKPTQPEPS